jgi:hypothetical protein
VRIANILLQGAPYFVGVNTGLFEDCLGEAWPEHPAGMNGDSHSPAAAGVPKLDVGTPLHYDSPAETLQRSGELGARKTRKTRHGPAQ